MAILRPSFVLMLACLGMAGLGGCTSTLNDGDVIRVNAPNVSYDAARQLTRSGVTAVQQGDLQLAESSFRKAIRADESYGPAHNNLGRVYFQQGDLKRAAKAFSWAMDFMPGRAEPINNLGLTLEMGGKHDEAIELFQTAHATMPEEPEYLANSVKARIQRGDRGAEVRADLQTLKFIENRPEWKAWIDRNLFLSNEAETKSKETATSGSRPMTSLPSTKASSSFDIDPQLAPSIESVGPELIAPITPTLGEQLPPPVPSDSFVIPEQF